MRRIIIISLFIAFTFLHHTAHAAAVPESFSHIVKLRAKSVVNISTTQVIKEKTSPFPFFPEHPFTDDEKQLRRQSLGSGFIIEADGYILTNYHVIDKAEDIRVRLWDESEYKATVVGKDRKTDIALIKIEPKKALPIAPLGDSEGLEVGDWVIAVGNPFGLGHTVTAGIVSAKGRILGAGPYDDFIQTDTAINPGNSGGPLFNINGEVVGINTAIFSPSGGNIGIGFAIPVNLARDIITFLKEKGYVERGWLGVTIQKVTQEIAESFDLPEPHGALVTDITPDSPADKAGLKRGDIIVEFNHKRIDDIHELPRLVAIIPIGTTVTMSIYRDGSTIELSVIVEKLQEGVSTPELTVEKTLGLKVRTLHPAIAEQFGIKDGGGVVVVDVTDDSPADRESILKGDIILEVNRKRVTSVEELSALIGDLGKNDTVLLLIKRKTGYVYISLRLE